MILPYLQRLSRGRGWSMQELQDTAVIRHLKT